MTDPAFLSDDLLITLVKHLMFEKVKVIKKIPIDHESLSDDENVAPATIRATRLSPTKWRFSCA
jgi:hypothetical protein